MEETQVDWKMLEDDHFFTTPQDFAEYAAGRKQLRMEYFYREQRKRFGILMEDDKPAGGQWNYDADNRGAFGKSGPEDYNKGPNEKPDELTREVLELVESQFP
ncbi:cryptochrome/photolyase family protein, partial [Arthrospira platensis SPKY1]|nr:cryptochrome/photolyase family protein [Arthrospira platensis SPKY1]